MSTEASNLITPKDLAKELGVSTETLKSWRQRCIGPAFIKLGDDPRGHVRYTRTDVDAWLAARKMGGAAVVIIKGA